MSHYLNRTIGHFGNYTKKNGDIITIDTIYDFILMYYIELEEIDDVVSIEIFSTGIDAIYCHSPLLEKVIIPSNMNIAIHCDIEAPINPYDYTNLKFRIS